ncbi:hypothetical protein MIND_01118800 [Mycena indigotica]|uniref:Uncharacterized protein n=1 Tax=Mycena indigotica TaxID=2126181 RepID=A0A8H6VVH3_9AGAR|nr:uncharacterized protein MIND_01118800 [Mycena indigotica]KAF7293416.1 hypothetical protein MIND_01118800 [Mycena indigotica]
MHHPLPSPNIPRSKALTPNSAWHHFGPELPSDCGAREGLWIWKIVRLESPFFFFLLSQTSHPPDMTTKLLGFSFALLLEITRRERGRETSPCSSSCLRLCLRRLSRHRPLGAGPSHPIRETVVFGRRARGSTRGRGKTKLQLSLQSHLCIPSTPT